MSTKITPSVSEIFSPEIKDKIQQYYVKAILSMQEFPGIDEAKMIKDISTLDMPDEAKLLLAMRIGTTVGSITSLDTGAYIIYTTKDGKNPFHEMLYGPQDTSVEFPTHIHTGNADEEWKTEFRILKLTYMDAVLHKDKEAMAMYKDTAKKLYDVYPDRFTELDIDTFDLTEYVKQLNKTKNESNN